MDGLYEYPSIQLCNPNKSQLFIIEHTKNLTITPRLTSISEVSFSIYKTYNDITLPYYDLVKKNKLIHIDGWGYFVIKNVHETFDAGTLTKEVVCYSYEYVLNNKGINILNGTYKFYDPINPDKTILYELFKIVPNWKIGYVDPELYNKYRTFDVPESKLYGFLMQEVSQTYEALFIFDIEKCTINAYTANSIVKDSNIILTFDNLLKNVKIEELEDDIYTVLKVNGADNLSIATVNPLGDNRLFKLDYYLTTEWFDNAELIDRVKKWQIKIEDLRPQYAALLKQLKTFNRELVVLKSEYQDLKTKKEAVELVRANQTAPEFAEEFKKNTDLINKYEAEMALKQIEIDNKNKSIDDTKTQMSEINLQVKYTSYFTTEERNELDPYIIEGDYTDSNFIVTDEMNIEDDANGDTYVITTTGTKKIKDLLETDILIDQQYIAEQLLEQGKRILDKSSQPSFSFTVESENFLFIEKFKPFIEELELGNTLNIEVDDDLWLYPALLEMKINYDNPTDFTMTFGNRYRLSTAEWVFSDLYSEQVKTSSAVGTTLAVAAEPVLNGKINQFTEYITNNLVAANQQIQATKDNEFVFGGFGLMGKKKSNASGSVNGYDPKQLWINNNLITMTDDAWQTVKLAIGNINGVYGVNADVVAGTLLCGNQLTIQDGTKDNPSTFIIDSKGARLTNASLSVSSGNTKILLDPQNGFKINNGIKDVFYADKSGNLNLVANINAAGGNIGGFTISKDSIKSTNDLVQLYSDGHGSLGNISWDASGNSSFKGSVNATSGNISGFNIGNRPIWSEVNRSNCIWSAGDNIILDSTGRVKLGNMTVDTVGNVVINNLTANNITAKNGRFEGTVYCKYLTTQNPDGSYSQLGSNYLQNGSVTREKLDTVYATQIYADAINAELADVHQLTATKASISQLNAVNARIDSLQASMITTDSLFTTLANATSVSINGSLRYQGQLIVFHTVKATDGKTIRVMGVA